MKKRIAKYYWSMNDTALARTADILRNPTHPRFVEQAITLLSRCDEPKELFRIIPEDEFIQSWPKIKRRWRLTGKNLDFMHWWDVVYENRMVKTSQQRISTMRSENSRHFANIGEQIKEARLRKEWSQEQLAQHAGMDQRKISAIETGKANITLLTLLRLTTILGLEKIIFKGDS